MRKKFGVLVLAILLSVFQIATLASAEQGSVSTEVGETTDTFNLAEFEFLKGYEYNKFDRTWTCDSAFTIEDSGAHIAVGLHIDGDSNGPTYVPYIYSWIRNADDGQTMFDVIGIDFLIGDCVYTYPTIRVGDNISYVFAGANNGQTLIEALSTALEISVRLRYSSGNVILEITPDGYASSIKPLAKALVKCAVWEYVDDPTVNDWEERYPLTVS